MKRFWMLMAWVAVGTLILALAAAGSASAGTARGTGAHRAPVHEINLHAASGARLGLAARGAPSVQGPIGGIVYPNLKNKPLHGRGGNDCAEPYCPVRYNGGPVQHNPHVYLLLWGPHWSSDPKQAATATYLEHFYAGLGVQPEDNWSTVTSQYNDNTGGNPTFSGTVFMGFWHDNRTPPTGVGQRGLAVEANTFASQHGITDLSDAQIVIATQSGTCPSGFYAPGVCGGSGTYCAWHSFSSEPYINLPYLLDAGAACGEDFVNSTHDGFSIVGGNEYAETITDPFLTGWYDPNDLAYPDIAGKCMWDSQHSHDVSLHTGSFAMQPVWSNSGEDCVMPLGGGTPDQVIVANPGSQSTYQESALSLPVAGTSSGQLPLNWSETGLPTGLSIKSSTGDVGVISGQITAPPGVYNVVVQAKDPTGAFGWYPFTWTVLKDVGTTITNQATGTCLNDQGYFITPGNTIFMYACHPAAANEMFTHPTTAGEPNADELIVLGQCLTDPNGPRHGGPGTLQVIEPCTGATNQEWFLNNQNEYVLGSNFLCLTAQKAGNAAPLVVEPCTGAADQSWSGP